MFNYMIGDKIRIKSQTKHTFNADNGVLTITKGDIAKIVSITPGFFDLYKLEFKNPYPPYDSHLVVVTNDWMRDNAELAPAESILIHIPHAHKQLFTPSPKACILPDVAGVLIAKMQSMLDNQNKLIINKPAVILYRNGKKYVVKTTKGDKWDEEKGVALALLKSFGVDYKKLKKIIEQAKRGDKKGK